MKPAKRRRRRVDWRVLKRIQDKALSPAPPSGVALQRELEEEYGDAAPSLRTTQMLLSEFMPSEPSAWWSIADGDPEDVALVLPVLAALYRDHHPLTTLELSIRSDTARWIVRVVTAAPDIDPLIAFEFANRLAYAERAGRDMRLLTLALALEVWRGAEHEQQAIADGLIPPDWAYVGPGSRNS
jgi:hypothetical protein